MLFSRTNKNKCTNAAIIAFKGKRNKSAGVCEAAKIFNLRDNESNQDFGYKETIAILMVATGDLGFGPKCE